MLINEYDDSRKEYLVACTECDGMVERWRSVKIMRLIDLLATIDTDVKSDEKVQICHPGRNWEDYDEFSASSKLLKPFYDLKVKSLSAINTDVIRVDLDFDEKG